jgi:hypothetical protein
MQTTINVKAVTAVSTAKDWTHSKVLGTDEADALYRALLPLRWPIPDKDEKSSAIYYGLSYTLSGGARPNEIPIIPPGFKKLADRIAVHPDVRMPVNYVQCHRTGPDGEVNPHRDPAGMIVPMLTVGQERTFRVGGTYPDNDLPQNDRPVESHIPAEDFLMRQGDLLVFNGGRTAHSMFIAAKDAQFNAKGCAYRISILFRWTTSIVRLMGPNRLRWSLLQIQQHEQEYRVARENFLEEHQPQMKLF